MQVGFLTHRDQTALGEGEAGTCGNPPKARAKVGQLGVTANLLWASKAFGSNTVSFKNVAPAKLVMAQMTSCRKT